MRNTAPFDFFSITISYFLLKYKFGTNSWWKCITAVFMKRRYTFFLQNKNIFGVFIAT